jgi:glutathione S-transferase
MGQFSLADIALVPSALRLKAHCSVSENFPLTRVWIQRLLERPHVQEWLTEAYALEPIYFEGFYSR